MEELMKEKFRSAGIPSLMIIVVLLTSTRLPADTGTCSGAMVTLPFTDVSGNIFFCQIAEAWFSGDSFGERCAATRDVTGYRAQSITPPPALWPDGARCA